MSILDASILLDLVEGQALMLVEQEQDNSLVAVGNQGVVLALYKDRLDFNSSVLVEPLEIPVTVLVLVEGFELACDVFHLRW
jgi:hypothetical protein